MKVFKIYKCLFLTHLSLLIGAGLIALANLFLPQTPLSLLLTFFSLLILPGFSLSKILKIEIKNDSFGQIVFYLTLGFIFALTICFFGILLGLNITGLIWLYLMLIGIIFIYSFITQPFRFEQEDPPALNFKSVFKYENLLYLLVFAVITLILVSLVKAGSLFKGGDVNYHLSIIRKAFGGEPLTFSNLSYVKEQLNIVYGFPVWHVFMAMLVKISNSSIYAVWRDLALSLTTFSFIIWFWFCRQIFSSKIISTLAFLLFMILSFYWGSGYLFSTLPIPHTLTQVLLIPLVVAWAIYFIYKDEYKSNSILVPFVLLLLISSIVHITAYFYFLFIIISLLFFDLIFNFNRNFWSHSQKILSLIALSLLIILPLAIVLEIKDQSVSTTLNSFQAENYPTTLAYSSFVNYGPFFKYAFICLPLILFFLKKYRQLILLPAVFMLVPIIYNQFVGIPLIKTVGYVLIKRLFGTLDWSFLVWGLVLGSGIIFLDRVLIKIPLKVINYTIQGIIALATGIVIILHFKTNWAENFFNKIIADQTLSWLDRNFTWIMVILALIFLLTFILSKKWQKIWELFAYNAEPKNMIAVFSITTLIAFILISPNFKVFQNTLANNHFKYLTRSTTAFSKAKDAYYTEWAGGKALIDYINTKIPPKSVFDTNLAYFILPIVTDQHMPIYYSKASTEHIDLYLEETSIEKRLQILTKYKIDYLLVKQPKSGEPVFDRYPEYFTKLFKEKHIIYKVNKEEVEDWESR